MTANRILIATDLPFWRGSNGAEQRILSLTKALCSAAKQVHVFCITPPEQRTDRDLQLIAQHQLSVEFRSSDQIPRSLPAKATWYLSAIWNQLSRAVIATQQKQVAGPMHLADFRWPWAIEAFRESFQQFQPDAVIIEYVKLAYLLEAIKPSDNVIKLVDTHDILHRRAEQFSQRDHDHWIQLSESEEAETIRRFDAIVAIEPNEADWFREVAPDANVIVCPHTPNQRPSNSEVEIRPADQGLVLGYLGSDNASNRDALQGFLDTVWPELQDQFGSRIRMVIGGAVGDRVQPAAGAIQRLGPVEVLENFYDLVDVVINPALYGTGLKIKCVEALYFGKPLVTTPAGAAGVPSSPAIFVCDQLHDLGEPIRLLMDPTRRKQAAEAALKLAETELSAESAYSELMNLLS